LTVLLLASNFLQGKGQAKSKLFPGVKSIVELMEEGIEPSLLS
jgi:hypothetical protein